MGILLLEQHALTLAATFSGGFESAPLLCAMQGGASWFCVSPNTAAFILSRGGCFNGQFEEYFGQRAVAVRR